jgi:signal transduction histidine kinase
VVRDISDRVERERQLQRKRDRYHSLFENTNDAVAWTEYEGKTPVIREANPRFGFYVADDGPGILEDEREDVFDVGYSTSADGNGFGLSIVARIAEAHGWSVAVTESDDGGARFEITGLEAVE